MGEQMRRLARPYGVLFAIALVMAVVARLGLFAADVTGVLAYDYISASDVPVLDVVCSILTGSAFVAFLAAAGLALCVSCAGAVLYGALFERGCALAGSNGSDGGGAPGAVKPCPKTAFLWGWATALVALICLLVVMSGIFSPVQVSSISSKLPAAPVLVLALVVFAAFLGTLLAAAAMTVCACVARARARRGRLGANLVIAALACGMVVAALTVGTFSAINVVGINAAAAGGWFAVDITANLIILFAAYVLTKRA